MQSLFPEEKQAWRYVRGLTLTVLFNYFYAREKMASFDASCIHCGRGCHSSVAPHIGRDDLTAEE